MRKERDGETTKHTVIEAAKTIFAENGFAGTSIAMISGRSGISSGLILHHFKSKANLYRTVLETLSAEYLNAITRPLSANGSVEELMLGMLDATFRYWSEDTVYRRISTWASLESQDGLVEGEARLTAGLAEKIGQMQSAGVCEDGFEPVVLLTMAIGPIHFWIQRRDLMKKIAGKEGAVGEMDNWFFEQYAGLVMKMFRPSAWKKEERIEKE